MSSMILIGGISRGAFEAIFLGFSLMLIPSLGVISLYGGWRFILNFEKLSISKSVDKKQLLLVTPGVVFLTYLAVSSYSKILRSFSSSYFEIEIVDIFFIIAWIYSMYILSVILKPLLK